MPTVDPIIADDALLLAIEASTDYVAQRSSSIAGFTNSVNTVHVDNVAGAGYAGAFFAGPKVANKRSFLALLVTPSAAIYKVTGTLNDTVDGLFVVSSTESLQSGAWNTGFPHYIALVSSATTVSGTVDGVSWNSAISFTPDISGQILLRRGVGVGTAKLFTCRTFSGNSVSFLPFPAGTVPVTNGLGSQSLWSSPERRLFQGTAQAPTAVVDDGPMSTVTYSTQPRVHAVIGAQFGDLEFDIGKSVPWVQLFADDIFITDMNLGNPRYWVIDWDRSFQGTKVSSLGFDFFTNPVNWRKAQFAAADAAWGYADDDWVLFLDGSEALSCDTRSSPDDVAVNPFRSFMHREVTRAIAAGKTQVSFPWYAFVRNHPIPDSRRFYQISSPTLVQDGTTVATLDPANTAIVTVAVPYYYQPATSGLVRLVKVSSLRNSSYNWSQIDTFSAPDADVKTQIISYSYARWTNPLTGSEDGLKMRAQISQVRPLAGLPVSGTDTTGVGGPYTVADNGVLLDIAGETAQTAPLLTPMYSSLFRKSPADGVWYVPGEIAPAVATPPYAFSYPPSVSTGYAYNATVSQ